MSYPAHTLGPTCIFHDDEATKTPTTTSSDPPPIKVQFFYVSSIPIDDPLSPLPPISSDTKSSQAHQPKPFSERDNAALIDAWQGIEYVLASRSSKEILSPSRPQVGERGRTLGELVRFPRFKGDGKSPAAVPHSTDGTPVSAGNDSVDRASVKSLELTSSTNAILSSYQKLKKPPTIERGEASPDETTERGSEKKHRRFSPFRKRRAPEEGLGALALPSPIFQTDGEADTDISRRPFARAPTLASLDGQVDHNDAITAASSGSLGRDATGRSRSPPAQLKPYNVVHARNDEDKVVGDKVVVSVGISRLHLVEMPDLLMKPIYWNPVNDISAVLRGTWFYATNMLPVESDLANWLEVGYQELKPWTQTWQDELNSCIEIGAEAEMKVVYLLFPERKSSRPGTGAEAEPDDTKALAPHTLLAKGKTVPHANLAAGPQIDKFHIWSTRLYTTI